MTNPQPAAGRTFLERLRGVSIPARKLFAVIVREAFHGPIHPKEMGTATPPEILEACGLDVAEFYALLKNLQDAQLIEITSAYPFEEIRLNPGAQEAESVAARCLQQKTPLEDAFVNLTFAPKN
jgi:hypothetical protein